MHFEILRFPQHHRLLFFLGRNKPSKMVTMEYHPEDAPQESYILCADCGTVIPASNGAGLCE